VPVTRISRQVRAIASGLVPGLGQALGGRLSDAALFAFAMLWVRGFLAGQAAPGERLGAFLFGAPAIQGGLARPVLVVFTALLVGLHALSAWAAWRQGARAFAREAPREAEGTGEVNDLAP
jgi:hypothetical protein